MVARPGNEFEEEPKVTAVDLDSGTAYSCTYTQENIEAKIIEENPSGLHDARLRRHHKQRAVDQECRRNPEEHRLRHADGKQDMDWKMK